MSTVDITRRLNAKKRDEDDFFGTPLYSVKIVETRPEGLVFIPAIQIINKVKLSSRFHDVMFSETMGIHVEPEDPGQILDFNYDYDLEVYDKHTKQTKKYKLVEVE